MMMMMMMMMMMTMISEELDRQRGGMVEEGTYGCHVDPYVLIASCTGIYIPTILSEWNPERMKDK